MSEPLKVGDRVRLNSSPGNPSMTVVTVSDAGSPLICCKYFYNGKFETVWLPEAALERLS